MMLCCAMRILFDLFEWSMVAMMFYNCGDEKINYEW